ncbi:16S rRNA (cytosine(967)-C(5))-methyltransferase RsmB [Aliikangiella sp. IMCC44632]
MSEPRLVAVNWLVQVVGQGQSINRLLAQPNELNPQQRALAKQLLFGSLRFYHQLQTILNNLLEKPLKAKDNDLGMVLIVGLYQMRYLSTPDHAAISEAVELAKKIHKPWAKGLINAVLRNYQRNQQALGERLQKSLQYQYSHPGWMIKTVSQDWPQEAEQIFTQNNQQAPMSIRVNTAYYQRDEYLAVLNEAAITAQKHPIATDGIVLNKAVDVAQLPGFTQGKVTVQDCAAQLAVELLDLEPNLSVLDACAAPGGKTTHILQREPTVSLVAVELSETRAEKITQTLSRMQQSCQVITANVVATDTWWDGQLFDRILLDVPCTAVGVIRRNPDIKVHRKVTDVAPTVELQSEILASCWRLLKPGGRLVYATCSIFKDENQNQIQRFMQQNACELVAMPAPIASQLNSKAELGYQIFPGENDMDGFYLCGLQKPA